MGFAVCKIVPPLMVFPPSLVSANYGLLHMETGDPLPLTGTTNVTFTWLIVCVIVIVALIAINALILHIAVKQARKIANQRVIIQFQQQQLQYKMTDWKHLRTISLVVTASLSSGFRFPCISYYGLQRTYLPFTLMYKIIPSGVAYIQNILRQLWITY